MHEFKIHLNIKYKTIKVLKENMGKHFLDIILENDFLNKIPETLIRKAEINKWNYIKLT